MAEGLTVTRVDECEHGPCGGSSIVLATDAIMGRMAAAGATHPGKVRPHNEDGLIVNPDLGLFAVADGMGGHKAGEVASSLALESILAFITRAAQDDDHTWPFGLESTLDAAANQLRTAVKLANRRVFKESERREQYTGMGTTVAAVLDNDSTAAVCGVGDSRVYLIKDASMECLTRDHTWVETLLTQMPGLDRATLAKHPMRHVLTSVVGAQDDVEVTVTSHQLMKGQRLVLCTDGVHGALTDIEIGAIVRHASSVQAAADELIQSALSADGRDNLTAVIVELAR
jgi:serine/threonine protein phosphatase PrpC